MLKKLKFSRWLQVELLVEEVNQVRGESGERERELEGRVREQADRLAVYQEIETEIDDVVLQAAQGQFSYKHTSYRNQYLRTNQIYIDFVVGETPQLH